MEWLVGLKEPGPSRLTVVQWSWYSRGSALGLERDVWIHHFGIGTDRARLRLGWLVLRPEGCHLTSTQRLKAPGHT